MTTNPDPLLSTLTRIIAREGRSRLLLWGFVLLCGLGAIWYWFTAVPREAFVDRDKVLSRVVGVVGALAVLEAGRRVGLAQRDVFRPADHPICRGLASGKLKLLQRDTGTFTGLSFDFGDEFQMLPVPRGELDGLMALLTQRFPGVPVQEIAVLVKRI